MPDAAERANSVVQAQQTEARKMREQASNMRQVAREAGMRSPDERLDQLNPRSLRRLLDAGFAWHPDLGVFYNRQAAQAVNFEAVRDHSAEWLVDWLGRESGN